MGRDWYWGGSRSSKRSGGHGGEKDSTAAGNSTPSGCMGAVLHFLDFHQFQFPLHHQPSFHPNSFLPDDQEQCPPKGVEAPRNSLELGEAPLPSTVKEGEDENLNIKIGIQIKTNKGTRSKAGEISNDSSSDISCSPGTKTPNLVARLMGLDLLPDRGSPSSPSIHGTTNLPGKPHLHYHYRPRQFLQNKPTSLRICMDSDISGIRSLPETPRISSARRSDAEHRLSLQINKETLSVSEDLEFSRFTSLRRQELKADQDENRSPSQYARQLVKQVKESVGRKVGLDITNTVRNREVRREELVISQFKFNKSTKTVTNVVDEASPGNHSKPSCSPRLRFLESKNKPVIRTPPPTTTKNCISQPPKPPFSASSQENIHPPPIKIPLKSRLPQAQEQKPIKKCKKVSEERFGPPRLKKPPQTSDIIRNKQEEPFVVRAATATRAKPPETKCKKTPLSNERLNITGPSLLPVKKDPSPPATRIPPKQRSNAQESKCSSQLSSYSSQSYKQEETEMLGLRGRNEDRFNGAATTTITGGGAEYEYITRMLRRTGIDKNTPVSFTSWFSPSHPLDPTIFYELEHFPATKPTEATVTTPLHHRCNRKLLFHLIDEILVEILKPQINMKPWVINSTRSCLFSHVRGSQLIDTLCKKAQSFPSLDCRVLEDIDALIDKDLPQMKQQSGIAFEEEGEGIVAEIERDLLETLIHEAAMVIYVGA